MAISFQDLPRELRDKIYSEMLTSEHDISFMRDMRANHARRTRAAARPEGVRSLNTAILYVNRQISSEASEVLYATNMFAVSSQMRFLIRWLSDLPARHRAKIRHLNFPVTMLMKVIMNRSSSGWKDLYALICGTHENSEGVVMHLTKVSAAVPLDWSLYEPSRALDLNRHLSFAGTFWWGPLKFFASLLGSRGHSNRETQDSEPSLFLLHLRYPFDKRGTPESHKPFFKPFEGESAFSVEDLEAVRSLRTPRYPADEAAEDLILRRIDHRNKRKAWREYYQRDEITSREKLQFRAYWVAGCEGQELVLSNARLRTDEKGRINGDEYGIHSSSRIQRNVNFLSVEAATAED